MSNTAKNIHTHAAANNPEIEVGLGSHKVNGMHLLFLNVNGVSHSVILSRIQWNDLKRDGVPVWD